MLMGRHRHGKIKATQAVWSLRAALLLCLCLGMPWSASRAQALTEDCSVGSVAASVKTMSAFDKVESLANALLHAQSQALIEMQSGQVVGIDDGGFFGPTGTLSKSTGKAQSELSALVITVKRLDWDATTVDDFADAVASAKALIVAGFQIVDRLENNQIARAVEIYTHRSLLQYKRVFATVYTENSGAERDISILSAKCR